VFYWQRYRFALPSTRSTGFVRRSREHGAPAVGTRALGQGRPHVRDRLRTENPKHFDHALANPFARGFWASPFPFDRELIAAILARRRVAAVPARLSWHDRHRDVPLRPRLHAAAMTRGQIVDD
jgi:hypothetical protein